MARPIVNNMLPNFSVIDSPLELRKLLRESSSLLFFPNLALQRMVTEDHLKANGCLIHRVDGESGKISIPPTLPHPGRVLTCYITNCTGFSIPSHQVQQVVFWGIQPMEHLAQARARVRTIDNGVLLTQPVPGYIYMGAE